MTEERIVVTWSGGIDSTGVLAQLLWRGWDVLAVTLEFGPEKFVQREAEARKALLPHLSNLGGALEVVTTPADWLWAFSPDGREIPTRNRRILDHLIAAYCVPRDILNIGMGEYIGCDTWVVRDHVGAQDCDARSLTAYLYEQYGLGYRLVTLADFGESRYKSDRLKIGAEALGDLISLTSNCLVNADVHCGRCYKCVERAAAFDTADFADPTSYEQDPRSHKDFYAYLRQMAGIEHTVPVDQFAL